MSSETEVLEFEYSNESLDAHPPMYVKDYFATHDRAPMRPPVRIRPGVSELTGPLFSQKDLPPNSADLTRQGKGDPIGERIIVAGEVRTEDGIPLPHTLIEIWQANGAGRYIHKVDHHDAPLDPNFYGAGRLVTDEDGRYSFLTIKPGAYPVLELDNVWRPAHIHFSLFGPAFLSRIVTQMYFPGDPLLEFDSIFQSVPERSRPRLIAKLDRSLTKSEWALGFRYDFVLRGRRVGRESRS